MKETLKSLLHAFEIIDITASNFEPVMAIYDSNHAFFIQTEGKEATLENSLQDIHAIPPGFEIANKIYVGIWENGEIVGVLDMLLGYPAAHCVWIGLLLIHGHLHGKRYGSRIVMAIFAAAKIDGYTSIKLGVIDNNETGIRFWDKHGFKKIRESTTERNGVTPLRIVVMEYQI